MTLQFGLGLGGVDFSSLPSPRPDQELYSFYNTAGGSTTTHRTIQAGKVFYVTSVNITCAANNPGAGTLYKDATILGSWEIANANESLIIHFTTPIKISAGEALKSAPGSNESMLIVGWEESA